MHLHVSDAKKPFDEEFRGCFDLVNLRLLVCALDEEAWGRVARNVNQLLRPGGGIQWAEADFLSGAPAMRGELGTSIFSLYSVASRFLNECEVRFRHVKRLREVLSEQGFEEVAVDTVSSDRLVEKRADSTRLAVHGAFLYFEARAKARVQGAWDAQELAESKKAVEQDIISGAYYRYDMHMTVGFK